jgi:hypothetical protein
MMKIKFPASSSLIKTVRVILMKPLVSVKSITYYHALQISRCIEGV